jgi:hypothetical protein
MQNNAWSSIRRSHVAQTSKEKGSQENQQRSTQGEHSKRWQCKEGEEEVEERLLMFLLCFH